MAWGTIGAAYNLLTTEFNSLASGALTAMGPEIDNTSNAYQMGRLRFHIASNSLVLTATSRLDVFFFPSNAGSNYPTIVSGGSYKLAVQNYIVASMPLYPTTLVAATLDEWLEAVFIPAGKWKAAALYVGGGAGTLPSSGNTLDIIPTP